MFVLALLAVAVLMAFSMKRWFHQGTVLVGEFIRSLAKAVGIVFPLFFLGVLAWSSFIVVPPGGRGVVFNKLSGIKPQALNEGFNVVLPWIEDVYVYDIRLQKVEFEATAASKDLQSVRTKVALNFRPHADSVADIHRNVGIDYAEKVIHPAVQEAVKATTALYTAEELITKREGVKKQIHELLKTQMAPAKLDLAETYITDFQFSSEFARAVEAKQIAEQDAFKAKRDLDRIRIEAEQKVATAQAEARSLTLQREAITTNLIELRRVEAQRLAIEKWDGRLPQTMLGNGSMPLIDLNAISGKR